MNTRDRDRDPRKRKVDTQVDIQPVDTPSVEVSDDYFVKNIYDYCIINGKLVKFKEIRYIRGEYNQRESKLVYEDESGNEIILDDRLTRPDKIQKDQIWKVDQKGKSWWGGKKRKRTNKKRKRRCRKTSRR